MYPGRVVLLRVAVGVGVWLASMPALTQAGEPWRVDEGEIVVLVPLKPGGAFEAKSTSLSGGLSPGTSRPLALEGELASELATLETGISLRDRHLRERYLEVARGPGFDRAVLSDIVLRDADDTEFRGPTDFSGTFQLHGVTRAVEGKGEIRSVGTGVRVEASFSLTLTDFEIEPPEYLGVGVANKVAVRVAFEARKAP
jgi:polyisoprenoid-binding protein YceI